MKTITQLMKDWNLSRSTTIRRIRLLEKQYQQPLVFQNTPNGKMYINEDVLAKINLGAIVKQIQSDLYNTKLRVARLEANSVSFRVKAT